MWDRQFWFWQLKNNKIFKFFLSLFICFVILEPKNGSLSYLIGNLNKIFFYFYYYKPNCLNMTVARSLSSRIDVRHVAGPLIEELEKIEKIGKINSINAIEPSSRDKIEFKPRNRVSHFRENTTIFLFIWQVFFFT